MIEQQAPVIPEGTYADEDTIGVRPLQPGSNTNICCCPVGMEREAVTSMLRFGTDTYWKIIKGPLACDDGGGRKHFWAEPL